MVRILANALYLLVPVSDQFSPNQSLKHLTAFLRWLIRPSFCLAIAMHALLLFAPLPSPKKTTVARPDSEVGIKITRLPPSPSPETAVTSQPLPATVRSPNQTLPNQTRSTPVAPTRLVSAPQPTTAPSSQLLPQPSPESSPQLSPDPPAANLQMPFSNFPELVGAQPGCFSSENCRQVSDGTTFRNAAQTLEQQMVAQGYQVSERDDLADTGQKIYQLVAQDGTMRYLNVLSADVGSTIYLLSPEPITLSELQQVETVQANLESLLGQLGNEAIAAQIPYPTLFLAGTSSRPEVRQIRLAPGVTPDQLVSTLTNTLQNNQFYLSAIGSYGGGKMYEVGKKAFTGYVNLVATADGTGTMMVLWNTLPR